MRGVSSGEPVDCELRESGAGRLMVLLTRCDWCWVLDTAIKPSERLLQRDDVYGDVRVKALGVELVILRPDAFGKLPHAGLVGASKPKYDSRFAVFGPKNDGSVAPERSRNIQLNPSVQSDGNHEGERPEIGERDSLAKGST